MWLVFTMLYCPNKSRKLFFWYRTKCSAPRCLYIKRLSLREKKIHMDKNKLWKWIFTKKGKIYNKLHYILFWSALLMYNLWTVKLTNFKCAIWWILTHCIEYYNTHYNHSITPRAALMAFYRKLLSPTPWPLTTSDQFLITIGMLFKNHPWMESYRG